MGKKASEEKAQDGQNSVFIFEVECCVDDEIIPGNFTIPETPEEINQIVVSLMDGNQTGAIKSGSYYLLHDGVAIPAGDFPDKAERAGEIIAAMKDEAAKKYGTAKLRIACVTGKPSDFSLWTRFLNVSELPGFQSMKVYGIHPFFGPAVQGYDNGEFDTGIEEARQEGGDTDEYCLTSDRDTWVGEKHLIEFLDASFYE